MPLFNGNCDSISRPLRMGESNSIQSQFRVSDPNYLYSFMYRYVESSNHIDDQTKKTTQLNKNN